jgi:hypothetical protein
MSACSYVNYFLLRFVSIFGLALFFLSAQVLNNFERYERLAARSFVG